jgi:cytochrome o ubiquinol oxidase operon protein cyoD
MSERLTTVSQFEPQHGSLRSYTLGFVSCIIITLVAYSAAVTDSLSDNWAMAIIAGLAIVQFMVQLRLFLHLGAEFRPRWKVAVFTLMITFVVILVAGSLWIMSNLNYRMLHDSRQLDEYVESQDGL